ncbi:MAG: hypothetical protein UW92_C0026G0006 [Candidatus Jorgensenbacteria bacterium GW2011_GWA2_45_13]|uniref:Uncharacterized protein n=1 Tax=Candidatus Jorgensenbacteria bacterium GW2011_GWA2_45_13 TaxID=1618662 RepID=A0A0G1P341_9BACT|nr:MAG: hypothetical protein UW92_C0026G0006 [Candidatus Jorgensenbacteria bacterium GW2011_GWA2_45_13]
MSTKNREVVVPTKFESHKPIPNFMPIPEGYVSLDDFEMNAVFPIVVFSSPSNGDSRISITQKLRDRGDSFIVGKLGD